MKIKREDILSMLKVSPRRYNHILGTEKAAVELAKVHHPHLNCEDVSVAALLHDLTKECTVEEHLEIAKKFGIDLIVEEISSPKLFHSKTASFICRYELKLPDYICDAVYYHTTGKPSMSPLEEIIYFADYIEETRVDEQCIELRNKYLDYMKEFPPREAFDRALVSSFDRTIINLINKNNIIDKNTVDARNFYLNKILQNK